MTIDPLAPLADPNVDAAAARAVVGLTDIRAGPVSGDVPRGPDESRPTRAGALVSTCGTRSWPCAKLLH